MKPFRAIILLMFIVTIGIIYSYLTSSPESENSSGKLSNIVKPIRGPIVMNKYLTNDVSQDEVKEVWLNKSPSEWGEYVAGVQTKIDTEEKIIALTFDACGGPYGDQYDEKLVQFLREREIPATLFFNSRWINENKETFLDLANDPLFSVQNHGTNHLPLSVNGKTAWGIKGTHSVEEVIEEVMENQHLIEKLIGKSPKYFRSGTAFYDDVAVKIVNDLGLTVVNFDILGDAGATFSAEQVKKALLQSTSGSIPLLHMNQPSSETAEGVMQAIPRLEKKGFSFVFLNGQPLEE